MSNNLLSGQKQGVEDIAALSLRLSAIEQLIAEQGVVLRGAAAFPGAPLSEVMTLVRGISAPLVAVRALGREIEALAERLLTREQLPSQPS